MGSGTATYDDQDRLLTYGGNAYTYSANGELATKNQNGHTVHYTYDIAGNLRTVLFPDSLQIDYVIDAANRRVGKKVNGVLVQGYLYKDGLSPVAKLDGAGNVTALFVYGSRLTVPDYMVQEGVTYRLFTDHLGSVRLVVNTTDGSIAQRIDYDAFGRVILDTNPGFQPFGFAGGLYDSQTGLIRFGARDYDPETGRWTSKDPAGFSGGDTNLYGYVVNDPVNNFDPNGLYSAEDFLQDAGNLAAGFGDTITLGATKKIRQWMGTDNTIQQCSGAYKAGRVGGVVWQQVAAGELGGALLGAEAAAGGAATKLLPTISDSTAEQLSTEAAEKGLVLSRHAIERLAERESDVSLGAVQRAIEQGQTFYDPKNGSIASVLEGGMASGDSLLVGQNPQTGIVTTVLTGAKLIRPRFIPLPPLP